MYRSRFIELGLCLAACLAVHPASACDITRYSTDAGALSQSLGAEVEAAGSALARIQAEDDRRRREDRALNQRAQALRSQIESYEARRPPVRLRLGRNFLQALANAARDARRYSDPPYIVRIRQELGSIEADRRRLRQVAGDASGAASAADAVLSRLSAMDTQVGAPLPRLALHVVGANVADEIARCFPGPRATRAQTLSRRFDQSLAADAPAAQAAAIDWAGSLRQRAAAAQLERVVFGRPAMRGALPAVRQTLAARLPRLDWLDHFPARAGVDFAGIWRISPDQSAERVAQALGAGLFSDNRLHCQAPGSAIRSANPQAQQLLDVASAKTVLILAHGFAFSREGWRYSASELEHDFGDVIALGRRIDPQLAFCTVNWNSDFGIDDSPSVLPDLYLALRLLADHPALYRKDRTIAMIGHSAGGNLIKYGYVLTRGTLAEMDRTGVAATRTRIVTLGTPHLGARIANTGVDFFRHSSSTSLMANKARTRGAARMQTLDRNPELALLNAEFVKVEPAGHVFGFAGGQDTAVEQTSALPDFVQGWRVADRDHNGLLLVPRGSDYARLLGQAISGQGLGL